MLADLSGKGSKCFLYTASLFLTLVRIYEFVCYRVWILCCRLFVLVCGNFFLPQYRLSRFYGVVSDSSELIFDHCKNDQCILDLSADATKCLLKTWWNDNLDKKANGSCLADPNDSMLTESSFSLFDTSTGWGHCLLALPRGTTLSLQVSCTTGCYLPPVKRGIRTNSYSFQLSNA